MPSLELRPRLATEIVDAGFQLYRRHFQDLVTLSAVTFSPYILVLLVLTGGQPIDPSQRGAAGLLILLGWIFGSLTEAATVVAVSNSYLHDRPDVPGALRHTLRRFGTVLYAVSLKWGMVSLGLFVAVLISVMASVFAVGAARAAGGSPAPPLSLVLALGLTSFVVGVPVALWFYARYFAVPATIVLEGLRARPGLRRSSFLSRGFKGKVYGALGLPTLLFTVVQFVVPLTLNSLHVPQLFSFAIEQSATVTLYPLIAVIATLLYYDARIRKEGFDIEVMAAELGGTAQSAPAAGQASA